MRLLETPLLPMETDLPLRQALTKALREITVKVNQMASGYLAGSDATSTTAPSTGTWRQGDFVKKSNPVEAGAATTKYVVMGWCRLTSGSTNVLNVDWVESRATTGN